MCLNKAKGMIKIMEDILLSIWCITYNHEAYIKDAIEGFLSQKTNFRYEIIIHDDASTDRTSEIIKEYEHKYPDLIRGVFQTENQYSKNQFSTKWIQNIAIQNCKGKYIAVCEGDDYWIDTQKLQLQVNYLENHPECVMTVHDAFNIDCRNYTLKSGNIYDKDCVVPPGDIIIQNKYMFSASMVYRKNILQVDEFFLNVGIGDYTSLLYSLTLGNIYYFARTMSVYRQFLNGSWTNSFLKSESMRWKHNILMIEFLEKYNEYTEQKFEVYVISKIQKSVLDILWFYHEISEKNFRDTYKKNIGKSYETYEKIFEQLNLLRSQIFNETYMDRDVCDFIDRYQNVVIMGAGEYASIVAKQLKYWKIDFEGFVVSNNQDAQKNYMNKPVWKFDEIPYDIKKIGVLIGINPIIWDQIMISIDEVGVDNYICPFCWKF